MSSVVISGDTSGAITLSAPAVSGTNTATLPAATGTVMVSGNNPTFSVYKSTSADVNLTNNVWTKIIFDTEQFDTNNCFDSTTNYRFTPTVAGYYQIQAATFTNWATSQWSAFHISIYKNGLKYKDTEVLTTTASVWYGSINIQDIVYMNGSTDYIEFYVQSTGGVSPVYNGPSYFTYASGTMVRSA